MPVTVYLIEHDPAERQWLMQALAPLADTVIVLDHGIDPLLAAPPPAPVCLVAAVDPADAAATLEHVRRLRAAGRALPVVALGPHSAFRIAVEIALLPGTDFLERPVAASRLRAALRAALARSA